MTKEGDKNGDFSRYKGIKTKGIRKKFGKKAFGQRLRKIDSDDSKGRKKRNKYHRKIGENWNDFKQRRRIQGTMSRIERYLKKRNNESNERIKRIQSKSEMKDQVTIN